MMKRIGRCPDARSATMNKQDLIAKVAADAGMNKTEATSAVQP
jgi:hypothetical protein